MDTVDIKENEDILKIKKINSSHLIGMSFKKFECNWLVNLFMLKDSTHSALDEGRVWTSRFVLGRMHVELPANKSGFTYCMVCLHYRLFSCFNSACCSTSMKNSASKIYVWT